jgi:mannose/cellobiose epimerase-like protein (N-acyl-D-glucosamine 2-epimerase family)
MERMTILNDVPGDAAWKTALDQELRRVLEQFAGPWTVRLRPVEAWQGGSGSSVEVTRPGHVWMLRVNEQDHEPATLARCVAEAVRPERFGSDAV